MNQLTKRESDIAVLSDSILAGFFCTAGVLNRVPSDFGRVVVKTVTAFGFREGEGEAKEGPYAENGQDSLATSSDRERCCDIVAVTVWVNGEKYPEPLVARAKDDECLIRATWTLAPKQSAKKAALKSGRVWDLLEVIPG